VALLFSFAGRRGDGVLKTEAAYPAIDGGADVPINTSPTLRQYAPPQPG
jgi:hypothetical protein